MMYHTNHLLTFSINSPILLEYVRISEYISVKDRLLLFRTESRAVLSEKRNSRNMMKFYPLQIKSFVFRNIIIAAVCTQETALWLTTATIAYAI